MASNIEGMNTPAAKGTSTSNRYIKIADKGTGTYTGNNVDEKLTKTDRLLDFAEKFVRKMNSESVNNLLSAGELDASWVYFKIPIVSSCIDVENACLQGAPLDTITIYTTQLINKKITITDETEYKNCWITSFERTADDSKETFEVWFRYSERNRNFQPVDQTGTAMGNLPSHINFTEASVEPQS